MTYDQLSILLNLQLLIAAVVVGSLLVDTEAGSDLASESPEDAELMLWAIQFH